MAMQNDFKDEIKESARLREELRALAPSQGAGTDSMRKVCAEAWHVLEHNGGPIDGDNGVEYVMVRRQDFEALELAAKVAKATPEPQGSPARPTMAKAKNDTYALKAAGWKAEHPKGTLGSHPAVWISPTGERMGFAKARLRLTPQPDEPAPGPTSFLEIHGEADKAREINRIMSEKVEKIAAKTPGAPGPGEGG